MAYASLAQLPVEFGLYSSFMGVLIYWFFATSKDITIGPVAVLSTVTGSVILKAEERLPGVPRDIVASSLAIISGAIVLFLGLARLGWIVDLISLPAISAFMTGSAINIAVGQVPALMGITGFSTRESPYKVIINILKHLGRTDLNASFGLTALFLLYFIRFSCNQLARRFPSKAKTFFFLNTLRTAFVILLYVLFSYLVNRHHRANKTKTKIKTLGSVPRGKLFYANEGDVANTNRLQARTSTAHYNRHHFILRIGTSLDCHRPVD
jgi:sodium-independent sulfate anion transporter 11